MKNTAIRFISELETIIGDRLVNANDSSYTAELFAAGTKRIAQKVGEEGVELALAATSGDENEVVEEAADLIYHVLVLLANQGLCFDDVVKTLSERHSK